ncbi:polysaccharide lyase [Methylocystis parvus]|uniref:Polysaccharide lyase-like protein n=1 Tax=Methylocystis parvus TaxID=134 RepID=A0A6B8MEX6_9HYPH|nr:polysaccharide lyase [Methylocystis parvus]QGM99220.1 hypothetical protein F7D14_18180 [Methylocystis parvus]WBK00399.1 polysaccharide lyase [Methylocystis parvus OBBP]
MLKTQSFKIVLAIVALAALSGFVAELGFLSVSLFAMGGWPFIDDFSDGFAAWNVFMRQTCCGHSATVVDAPLLAGKKAASFELRFEDETIKGSKRSEFRLSATRFGVEYDYRFKIFVPQDWVPDESATLLMQMHNVPDLWKGESGLAPPIDLEIVQDAWVVRVAKGKTPNWVDRVGEVEEKTIWRAPVDLGKWTEWRIRLRWSTDEDGYVEIEKDGAKIVDRKGANSYDNLLAPYMKFGVYVPAWKKMASPPRAARRSALFTDIAARRSSDVE